jgi:hypothetical protein
MAVNSRQGIKRNEGNTRPLDALLPPPFYPRLNS